MKRTRTPKGWGGSSGLMGSADWARLRAVGLAVAIAWAWGAGPAAMAAESAVTAGAVTTGNPEVPLDELELLLLPLDKTELEVEAAAWMALTKAKIHELSDAEIAAKYKRIEIARANEAAEAAREAQGAAEEAEKVREDRASGEGVSQEEVVEAAEEAEAAAAEVQVALGAAAEAEQRIEEHEGAQEVTEEAVEEAEELEGVSKEAEIGATALGQAGEADADQLEQVAEAVEEAAEAKAEVREAIFERVTELRNQRTELLARSALVLDKLEEKGGEVDEQRRYLEAVAGTQIDVTDTTATWATLEGWLKAPQGGMRWIRNFARFVAILLLAWVLSHLLSRLAERALRLTKGLSELTRVFVQRTLKRLVLAFGFLAALASLEVSVGPMLAVLGAASFVLAFALQDSLGNLASGIMIMLFRPFDIGDVVSAAGTRGKVDSMNIVSTTVRTPDNQRVVVPNRKIWGDVITNVTGSKRRRVDLKFRVGLDADLDQALGILERILEANARVLAEPQPEVLLAEVDDSAMTLRCRPWALTGDWGRLRSEVTRAAKEEFDKAGIPRPIPLPYQRVTPQG